MLTGVISMRLDLDAVHCKCCCVCMTYAHEHGIRHSTGTTHEQARIRDLEELVLGEVDVCSVFFTRLHQSNQQLQSRIKTYEEFAVCVCVVRVRILCTWLPSQTHTPAFGLVACKVLHKRPCVHVRKQRHTASMSLRLRCLRICPYNFSRARQQPRHSGGGEKRCPR